MKESKKNNFSNQELISLYAIFHDMQKRCTDEICKYLGLYFNANILILGGGIAILAAMNESIFMYVFLFLCGLLVIVMSVTMLKSTKRVYYNQLEYIAQSGQIEDLLKFKSKKIFGGKNFFQKEGLIVKRHLANRKTSIDDKGNTTKEAFADKFVKGGQRKYIVFISWTFIAFGAILALCPIISYIFKIKIK